MKRIATAVTTFLMLAGLMLAPATLAQPTVDGQTDDADYILLGEVTTAQVSEFDGEGIKSLKAYRGNGNLYIAVEGKVEISDSGNFPDFMIFVDVDNVSGIAQGTDLPAGTAGDSPFGFIGGMNMDMEVDYGFRLTGDTGGNNVAYASIADYTNLNSSNQAPDTFEGSVPVDGSTITGNETGGTYAYVDAASLNDVTNTGWEFSIPLSVLGVTASSQFQLFATYGNVDGGPQSISAHIVPDAGQSMTYAPDEDWTAVSGTQATTSAPLPVELAGFDAQLDGRAAMLTWRTLSETNNDRFEIEHAAPGQSYQTIGTREGQGTTDQPTNYSFRVADLDVGTHQFRLRQIDVDGTPHLSPVERVEVGTQGLAVIAPQPHPVVSSSTVGISVEETSPVTVELYNLLGQRVRTLYDGTLTPGRVLDVEIDATQLPSGTYFVRTTSDLGQNTQRVAVIR